MPVVEHSDGSYLPDSDKIVPYLEQQFPQIPMDSAVPAEVGAKLFPAFRGVLNASAEELPAKEADLVAELQVIEDYLAAKVG